MEVQEISIVMLKALNITFKRIQQLVSSEGMSMFLPTVRWNYCLLHHKIPFISIEFEVETEISEVDM